jgi:hypothetical protein
VEILEDYVMREGFVVSPTVHRKTPSLKVKFQHAVICRVRMEQKEDGKAAVNMPFRFKKQERS